MSPKLLRRMQSSTAYRVNVCMVIYPPRSQNLHPVWPTYRELWPQPCHTTARRLRSTRREENALGERTGKTANTLGDRLNRFNRRLSSTYPCGRDRSRYRNDISWPAFAAADGGNMRVAR
ncbi:hypothetical protein G5I_02523 [Acromyrmex echinatior]|uniref:Uncharacterized protein n=1 Tax=Acromyrmex echinatior TaxID=103372 RepID=F4WAI6_ACREC|nr:hypothetical protein G5I_02523 [Acromyrmex echinatior]